MAIQVECACGKRLRVPEEHAGKKVRCTGCQAVMLVPAAELPEAAVVVEDEAEEAGYAMEKVLKCPGCKHEWPVDTKVCIDCGYNFETGRKMQTKYNIRDRFVDLGSPALGTFTRYRVFRNAKGKPSLMVSRRFLFIPLGNKTYDLTGFRAILTDCVVGDEEEGGEVYYLTLEGPRWGKVKLLRSSNERKWREVLDMVQQAGRLEVKRA